jgi:6-pyruvoyltetrahydropterin/6-carboxytetrahydropterin synthase
MTERNVFTLDIGAIPPEQAAAVIERIKSEIQGTELRPKYISTKTYGAERGFAVAYRQYKAESHCNLIHGYAMGFHFEFESYDLDARNWVVDFGSLKTLKEKLDEWFDHTCLVAQDDPEFALFEDMHARKLIKMVVVERTGCEGLAQFLADYINEIWMEENGYHGRVKLRKVEVRETPSNSAMWLAPGL